MAKEVNRLKYFTGEFLQQQDFTDEQIYHRRLRQLHNRWLHTWGIAFGLDVAAGPGARQITVSPGMGIVKILEDGEELGKEVVLVASQTIDLPAVANATVYIAIGVGEVDGDPSDAQGRKMRIIERAYCQAFPPNSAAPDNQVDLILAKVTINAAGNGIAAIDTSDRLRAGMRGDIEATSLRFPIVGVDSSQWPRVQGLAGPKLSIASAATEFSGGLSVTGNIAVTGTVDGLDLSTHDHTAGKGLPIPWSALSGLPDIFVKAYVVASNQFNNNVWVSTTAARSFGLSAINPWTRNTVGNYTLKWTQAIPHPLIQITIVQLNDLLSYEITGFSQTSVTFNVWKTYLAPQPSTLVDPLNIMVSIF